MTRLLFIRHAETDLAGTFCGFSDPPVNDAGLRQIETLLPTLTDLAIEAAYTSDLQRAHITADAIVTHLNVPLTATSSLREMNFGVWEGKRWADIEQQQPAFAALWANEFPNVPAPDGEPYGTFKDRIMREIERIQAEKKSVVVVTHAGVMRLILIELCGKTDEQAWESTRAYCCSFLYIPPQGARL